MSDDRLLAAAARILRPLVRILLRNGVPADALTEVARKVFVSVASEEFRLEGKRQTLSRISVLTGLNRKEVSRLAKALEQDAPATEARRNRAAAVLSAWLRDPDFCDRKGDPLDLPLTGTTSFTELVKRHSGDMKPGAVADELIAAQALEQVDGKLRMTARGYVPSNDPDELLGILGTDAAELIETIDHNIREIPDRRIYQSKVKYDNVPAEHVAEFLNYSGRRTQQLLEELDRWLAARDRGRRRAGRNQRRVALGLGAFQILGASPYGRPPEPGTDGTAPDKGKGKQ
jgi:hypothetical protein